MTYDFRPWTPEESLERLILQRTNFLNRIEELDHQIIKYNLLVDEVNKKIDELRSSIKEKEYK